MMFLKARCLMLSLALIGSAFVVADEPAGKRTVDSRLTTEELARWIDERFAAVWQDAKIDPPEVIDDATFLKRTSLDLTGSIPSVSQARDFLDYAGEHRRGTLVDRLLNDPRRPEKYAERTAAHLANVWRRTMVPGNSQEARMAVGLEPWLKEQFAANVPYDELVRKLVTATNDGQPQMVVNPRLGVVSGGPALFFQAVGGKPETAASSVSRVFLGVRIGCAECHDHPFASWKQKDFWGMAAFFSGVRNGGIDDSLAATIQPANSPVAYTATFLGGEPAKLSRNKSPRETLANWMVAPENTLFAATAVNRVWQHLLGRGMTESVDDLDKASPAERKILDDLAKLFVDAKFDLRWLVAGICKSQLYQRECIVLDDTDAEPPAGLRPIKTLSPEQVFNSLEQALSLPVARADGSARFNGLREQLISRMNEAASNNPDEFRAGIPQALLLMNGRLTTEATDLDQSRTLRGVLDAPFLDTEAKLTTLYLATFSRPPRAEEKKFLLEHIRKQADGDKQKQAYAEIFWGLLNSPEFVLEK
ncbi:MAG: DUF1549 domain-containing protein [Planctomycetaceae bacterium]|nr:DUF1549 domain-containing protein [Planctomycetaceae bacterium]